MAFTYSVVKTESYSPGKSYIDFQFYYTKHYENLPCKNAGLRSVQKYLKILHFKCEVVAKQTSSCKCVSMRFNTWQAHIFCFAFIRFQQLSVYSFETNLNSRIKTNSTENFSLSYSTFRRNIQTRIKMQSVPVQSQCEVVEKQNSRHLVNAKKYF